MNESAHSDYATAGFGGSLRPGNRLALVVIDPIDAYVNPECPLYAGVEEAAERIRELVRCAREHEVPVIFTRVEHDPAAKNGGVFARKVPALRWFGAGSPFSGYIAGLEPEPHDVEVVKQYPSAFAGTSLASTLVADRVDTVVLVGFSTSGCIRASATDAMQSGFVPIVVADAVGDRLRGPHEANLFDIQAKIGEVVTQAQAIGLISAGK